MATDKVPAEPTKVDSTAESTLSTTSLVGASASSGEIQELLDSLVAQKARLEADHADPETGELEENPEIAEEIEKLDNQISGMHKILRQRKFNIRDFFRPVEIGALMDQGHSSLFNAEAAKPVVKKGSDTISSLLAEYLEHRFGEAPAEEPKEVERTITRMATPREPDPGTLYDRFMGAVRGAGDKVFGPLDIPHDIEIARAQGHLPEFLVDDHVRNMLRDRGMTVSDLERSLLPGASLTLPGREVSDAVAAARVGAPLAAAGLTAGAITKGIQSTRRHGELLSALKSIHKTKKTAMDHSDKTAILADEFAQAFQELEDHKKRKTVQPEHVDRFKAKGREWYEAELAPKKKRKAPPKKKVANMLASLLTGGTGGANAEMAALGPNSREYRFKGEQQATAGKTELNRRAADGKPMGKTPDVQPLNNPADIGREGAGVLTVTASDHRVADLKGPRLVNKHEVKVAMFFEGLADALEKKGYYVESPDAFFVGAYEKLRGHFEGSAKLASGTYSSHVVNTCSLFVERMTKAANFNNLVPVNPLDPAAAQQAMEQAQGVSPERMERRQDIIDALMPQAEQIALKPDGEIKIKMPQPDNVGVADPAAVQAERAGEILSQQDPQVAMAEQAAAQQVPGGSVPQIPPGLGQQPDQGMGAMGGGEQGGDMAQVAAMIEALRGGKVAAKKKSVKEGSIGAELLPYLLSAVAGGTGVGAAQRALHKRKIPQYEEKGRTEGEASGFEQAHAHMEDLLRESLLGRTQVAPPMPKMGKNLATAEFLRRSYEAPMSSAELARRMAPKNTPEHMNRRLAQLEHWLTEDEWIDVANAPDAPAAVRQRRWDALRQSTRRFRETHPHLSEHVPLLAKKAPPTSEDALYWWETPEHHEKPRAGAPSPTAKMGTETKQAILPEMVSNLFDSDVGVPVPFTESRFSMSPLWLLGGAGAAALPFLAGPEEGDAPGQKKKPDARKGVRSRSHHKKGSEEAAPGSVARVLSKLQSARPTTASMNDGGRPRGGHGLNENAQSPMAGGDHNLGTLLETMTAVTGAGGTA